MAAPQTAQQQVTEWDAHGVPVPAASEWDEHGNPIANVASEKEMAAHPPAAPAVQMREMWTPREGLRALNQPLPRPPGGGEEEEIAEGSLPAVAGLSTIGTLGMPIKAIATRSLAPLAPLARAYLGSKLGKYVGRDIGGMVGHPEAGETIGEIGGGVAGGMGVKVPSRLSLLKRFLSSLEPEAAEAGAAAPRLTRVSPAAAEEPFRLTSPAAETEPAIQDRLHFPETAKPETPEAGRLQPIGKARSPRGYTNLGRSEPVKLDDVVNQATGVKPLKPDVPLNEQLSKVTATEPAEIDAVKEKYPDPKVRQMVRANGENIYEAAKHDPATVQAIHDLTRVDLRQALINSGEDVGQQTVTNSKFSGEGGISRQEAFDRLLQKGHSPEDIVRLAKQTAESRLAPVGGKPEIEPIEHNGPRGNGSGEAGGGGLEEQSRLNSENGAGVKYFRETPGGGRQPLIGLGRQDLRAGPGQRIIRVEANGHETVLDAQPARLRAIRKE